LTHTNSNPLFGCRENVQTESKPNNKTITAAPKTIYYPHKKRKEEEKNTAKNNKTQDRVFSGTKQIEEMVKEGISGTSVKRRNQIGQNTEIQKRKKT
jgi:hypothetical protein